MSEEQLCEITDGSAWLAVSSRGAQLRGMRVVGQAIMPEFALGHSPALSAGAQLVPWPNRVRDGRWRWQGHELALPINEVSRNTAIHGLVCDLDFAVLEHTTNRLRLGATLLASAGYPWELGVEFEYLLDGTSLTVTTTLHNQSGTPAPWAYGAHPYFGFEGVTGDQLTLSLAADSWLALDEQLIPIEQHSVDGTRLDLRSGRPLAALELDDVFCGLHPDASGVIATLSSADGRQIAVWTDEQFGYAQVFTPPAARARELADWATVAIEPMTAPADAFNSGTGLRTLAADERVSLRWGVTVRANVRR